VIFARRRYGRDNYCYLLAEGGDAALLDPGDAEAASSLASEHGVRPRFLIHTHGHPDHTGGSAALRERLQVRVLGHPGDAAWFAPDQELAAGPLRLGDLELRIHPAPGHTPGSVLVEWRGRLLTGDTLFWGGAGNCRHGGDPGRLADSFLSVLSRLDAALEVHPGHDYAEANLPFVLDLEPGNAAAARRLAEARASRAAGREPEAPTLGEERLANPFLRAGAPEVAAALAGKGVDAPAPREAFLALRRLRDRW
jgi:hydroxyacylglutathione hydrolase